MHVFNIEEVKKIAHISNLANSIFEIYSPGPITLILKKKDKDLFSSNLDTIGVRIPRNKTALEFLLHVGVPICAPSANISGKPSITKLEDIESEFSEKVDLILKGEEPEIGLESTVIDFSVNPPILLRHGKISYIDLLEYIPDLRVVENVENAIKSPGLKYRHYAPDCKVILCDNLLDIERHENSAQIGFQFHLSLNINKKVKDNLEYMKELYSFFIQCDKNKIQTAYCEIPNEDKYKPALMDRISRAIKK